LGVLALGKDSHRWSGLQPISEPVEMAIAVEGVAVQATGDKTHGELHRCMYHVRKKNLHMDFIPDDITRKTYVEQQLIFCVKTT